jgi:hypothetical protein
MSEEILIELSFRLRLKRERGKELFTLRHYESQHHNTLKLSGKLIFLKSFKLR